MLSLVGNLSLGLTMFLAEGLCDRLGIFVDGALRCIGNPKELTARFGGFYILTITRHLSSSPSLLAFWMCSHSGLGFCQCDPLCHSKLLEVPKWCSICVCVICSDSGMEKEVSELVHCISKDVRITCTCLLTKPPLHSWFDFISILHWWSSQLHCPCYLWLEYILLYWYHIFKYA